MYMYTEELLLILPHHSAGNNFALFTGHMSFQIFILVGHLTNWTGHHLLTDNTLKITQDVLVRCSVIVSDHNVKLAGHFQNLVGQCPMTDCYFQHCTIYSHACKVYLMYKLLSFIQKSFLKHSLSSFPPLL